MKKLICLLLAILMLASTLAFVSCGSSSTEKLSLTGSYISYCCYSRYDGAKDYEFRLYIEGDTYLVQTITVKDGDTFIGKRDYTSDISNWDGGFIEIDSKTNTIFFQSTSGYLFNAKVFDSGDIEIDDIVAPCINAFGTSVETDSIKSLFIKQ